MRGPCHWLLDPAIADAELQKLRRERERFLEEGRRIYQELPLPRLPDPAQQEEAESDEIIRIPLVDPPQAD